MENYSFPTSMFIFDELTSLLCSDSSKFGTYLWSSLVLGFFSCAIFSLKMQNFSEFLRKEVNNFFSSWEGVWFYLKSPSPCNLAFTFSYGDLFSMGFQPSFFQNFQFLPSDSFSKLLDCSFSNVNSRIILFGIFLSTFSISLIFT